MRATWLHGREESRARAAALLPLHPAAWCYGAGARLHRALYSWGALERSRLPCQVVSVGSLAVGGTGKTPLAAWIATQLHRRGRKVVLASRGYGRRQRRSERVVVVSDGRFVHSRAEEAGDEPLLLAAHAPGVPVLVGRDRALVGLRAFSAFGADLLVLDDGFQHHRLHRDLDILSFDGTVGFGNGRVLPRGPLREPVEKIRFAHAIAVFDGPLPAVDEERIERWAPGAYRFVGRRRAEALRPLAGGERVSPELLRGREVGVLAGLARPASLRASVEALGARMVAERSFRDHHRYRAGDLTGLARDAPLWVTTEKDAVKIPPAWAGAADVRVLVIEPEIERAGPFVDWLESRLR